MRAKKKTLALIGGLAIAAACVWLAFKAKGKPVEAIPAIAAGQSSPPMLYAAFTAGGPIVTGLIAEVQLRVPGWPVTEGKLVLEIDQKLRGQDLPDTLELPFELHAPSARRQPQVWERVQPEVGKRICLILAAQQEPRAARCVLDLDGEDQLFLPILKRMLELETIPAVEGRVVLLAALSDPSPWVRALATEILLATGGTSKVQIRSELSSALTRVARDSLRPIEERLQAVFLVGLKVYDGFTSEDEVNYEILSFLTSLLADPEMRLRAEAAHMLHGYLLGAGTRRPSAEKIKIHDREQILGQLQKDSEAQTYFAPQAAGLLKLLAKG